MLTHGKIDFLHMVRLYFLHLVRLTSYKQLFKTVTNSCLRLLQTVPVMLNYFSISYIYVYIHLMFSCENISFVCVATSPTVHVNGYSFRLDISFGNISFVLRTHRVCKENHSCSRLLQNKKS